MGEQETAGRPGPPGHLEILMTWLTAYATPDILRLRWLATNSLVASELALLTVELINDNSLHTAKGSRSVSPHTAHLLTGGYVIPFALTLMIAWLVLSRLPWVRDLALPLIGIVANMLVLGLTTGTQGVGLFLTLNVIYLAFVAGFARFLFFPSRVIALIAALFLIAGLLVPVGVILAGQ